MVFALRSVFCFVRISEQTAAFALYVIRQLVFITVVESVYCAVRTDSLYKADYIWSLLIVVESVYCAVRTDSLFKEDYAWSLNNRGGKCLLRGTD